MESDGAVREVFCGRAQSRRAQDRVAIVAPSPMSQRKIGSGAWTRTKITSSKGWRATNCTTPEMPKHFTSL